MNQDKLMSLVEQMKKCTSCGLIKGCNGVVPPDIGKDSRIFIIGEAPGQDEDILNRPFCGRSGQLLDKLLKMADINRQDIYVTNTVKCRPPNNRTPLPDEISSCKKWLWKELITVKPKIIITLGKTPTCLLLKLKNSITLGNYVGKAHKVSYLADSTIYPWYHPSFLLRQGGNFDEKTVNFLMEIKKHV